MKKVFSATLLAAASVVASSTALLAQTNVPCSAMSLGQNAPLNGFVPFPATDPWRTVVANAPVDPNSAALIAQLGSSALHPDFGSGTYDGATIGIPYLIESGQPNVTVRYNAYGNESDPGVMPIPASAWVEGYPSTAPGDRHVLVLDASRCFLYELGNAAVQGDGSWVADVGTIWDLQRNNDRPYLWTSADAAGLPIFPGLARYDEVALGSIQHALRFTVNRTRNAFVPPATHFASNSSSSNLLPMGARLRLKPGFDISGFPQQTRVILTALKTYGMIVSDNGSNLFLSGAPNDGWNNDDLHTLGRVPASAFEVVSMGTPITENTVPSGSAPVFSALAASATTVKSGTRVTLAWTAKGASSYVVTPTVGAVAGNTTSVKPTKSTTYTVVATNHFGRTTRSITINVK